MQCHICQKEFANELEVRKHLHKAHNWTPEQSYCFFHKDLKPNICPNCGKPTNFLKNKYTKFCSKTCIHQYNAKSEEVQNKRKQTNKEKYGYDYVGQVPELQKKKEQTNLEKYGVKNYTESKEMVEKSHQTKLERYGNSGYVNVEKRIETNRIKYGFDNVFQNKEIKNKSKKTKLEKYGNETYHNPEKACDTKELKYGSRNAWNLISNSLKQKYNINHPSESIQFIQKRNENVLKKYNGYALDKKSVSNIKVIETMNNKYGVSYPLQSTIILNNMKNTNNQRYNKDFFPQSEKYKNLYLDEKFVQNKSEKMYITKKNNNTFNISKPEDKIYNLLCNKFKSVMRQYKSEKYPFACDFYIPELDLYIEYQGNWTHGIEAFNENNNQHLEILNKWQQKTIEINFKDKTKKYYENAIKVWTISDPLKRKTAMENKLNWIEFFNMEQFMGWYDKI